MVKFRIKNDKISSERQGSKDTEYSEKVRFLQSLIDKTRKELNTEIYGVQKDIDTLKSSKLNLVEFMELKNQVQMQATRIERMGEATESSKALGMKLD